MNPKYTFDDFVIGAGNQFAHAASRAVAERPSKAYNPLFLYGGYGMGKTHLMQAIAHDIKKRRPEKSHLLRVGERFTNELVNAFRCAQDERVPRQVSQDGCPADRRRPVPDRQGAHPGGILPHLQRAVRRPEADRRSQRPPAQRDWPARSASRSRFEWGMVADIQPPDLETKVAILQKKAESGQVMLPTMWALFIASNIRSDNVRELEGALIRLTAYSSLTGGEIKLANGTRTS